MGVHEFIKKNTYGFDRVVTSKYITFEYYDFQKKIIDLIHENDSSLILKSRQMYVSTLLSSYSLYSIINNKKIFYVSPKLALSRMFLEKFRVMAIHYDPEIFEIDNKNKKKIKNGGSIEILSSDINSLNSVDFDADSVVIIEEAHYIKNLEQLMNNIYMKLNGKKIKIILSSTPKPYEVDYFFNLYMNSISGHTDFKSLKINYKDNPNHDETWCENMKRIIGDNMFKAEVLGDFVIRPKLKKTKNNLVQFRLNDELFNKVSMKLIENDINISTYLRGLITQDVNK